MVNVGPPAVDVAEAAGDVEEEVAVEAVGGEVVVAAPPPPE